MDPCDDQEFYSQTQMSSNHEYDITEDSYQSYPRASGTCAAKKTLLEKKKRCNKCGKLKGLDCRDGKCDIDVVHTKTIHPHHIQSLSKQISIFLNSERHKDREIFEMKYQRYKERLTQYLMHFYTVYGNGPHPKVEFNMDEDDVDLEARLCMAFAQPMTTENMQNMPIATDQMSYSPEEHGISNDINDSANVYL